MSPAELLLILLHPLMFFTILIIILIVMFIIISPEHFFGNIFISSVKLIAPQLGANIHIKIHQRRARKKVKKRESKINGALSILTNNKVSQVILEERSPSDSRFSSFRHYYLITYEDNSYKVRVCSNYGGINITALRNQDKYLLTDLSDKILDDIIRFNFTSIMQLEDKDEISDQKKSGALSIVD